MRLVEARAKLDGGMREVFGFGPFKVVETKSEAGKLDPELFIGANSLETN